MIIVLNITIIVLICIAGFFLTVRVYPKLYVSAHATGQDYVKDLQKITETLTQEKITGPEAQIIKGHVLEALSRISNCFVDNKVAVNDSIRRTKKGFIFLIIASLLQSLLLFF